jgi:predicted nucleic acid-binding protein
MIFIDTGPLLAQRLKRDPYHEASLAGWKRLEQGSERLATSNFILDELVTLLAKRSSCAFAVDAVRGLYDSSRLSILRPESQDEIAALGLMQQFGDPAISFTDYVSFALMKRNRIHKAFTFDNHFKIAGFEMIE